MTGVPSIYTDALAIKICNHIADGKSLRQIEVIDGMPCKATILNWCSKNKSFLDQYVRAKEEQAELLAEEILDIADNAKNDWMERNAPDNTGFVLNGEHVQRSRLRIDSRKWLAGKLKPKKYGDSINQKHTDGDGEPLKVSDVTQLVLSKHSTEELEAILEAQKESKGE